MAEVIYKLAGSVVQPPINGKSVEIELNYDTEDPDAVQVQVGNSWDFEKLSTAVINQHIANGLTGGVGRGYSVASVYKRRCKPVISIG